MDELDTLTADMTHVLEQTDADANDLTTQKVETSVSQLRSCIAKCKFDGTTSLAEHAASVWRLACQLWNTAVGVTARGICAENAQIALQVAWIRHVACDLSFELPPDALQEQQQLQLVKFCVKASEAWSALERWEQAEVLLAVAARLVDACCSAALHRHSSSNSSTAGYHDKAEERCALAYEVQLARYRTAWKLNQQELARQALSKARAAAEDLAPNPSISSLMCYRLARALHDQATTALAEPQDKEEAAAVLAALGAAYELLSKAKECRAVEQQQKQAAPATAGGGSGGADNAAAIMAKLLRLETKVLLSTAYCQLHHGKDPAACLKCVGALRQLETPEAAAPAVALLAFQAFMVQGCLEQAEKEATGIAVNDAASRDACLAVLLELLKAPVAATQLKPVLELVLGRFPSDPFILTTFTEKALASARTAATTSAAAVPGSTAASSTPAADSGRATGPATLLSSANGSSTAAFAQQLEALVLDQLERAEDGRQAAMADGELRHQLCSALYEHGVAKFGGHDFEAAVRFFSATLEVCEDRIKGRVARVLALCHMGLGSTPQAASYCSIADSYEPGDVSTSFIRFKLLLLQGDQAGALAELQHMAQCRGFSTPMLWFAVRESVTANTLSLAKSALQQLLALMQAQDKNKTAADTTTGHDANGSDTASCLSECVVIRALVKLQQQELEQHLSSAAAVATDAQKELDQQQQQTAPVQACIAELSETLNSANVRAKRLGVEQFTGEKEAAALQQVEWLSMCAWNAALQAAALRDYQGTAVLMNTSAQLLNLLPHLGTKQLKQQKMAYAMAAAAGLEVHLALPEHATSLKLAGRMAASSAAVAQKLPADPASEAYDLQLQFRVALYQGNDKEMAAIAGRMAVHPGVGPSALYSLVEWCSHKEHNYPDVARIALEGTLQKLMAVPAPNYSQVSLVLRTLLQRSTSDDSQLKLYREACGIVATLQPGTYPPHEAHWLLSTAWNTGIHHARFGRHRQAVGYMQAALELLPACPTLIGKKAMMTQQLQKETAAANTCARPAADIADSAFL